MSVAFVTGAAGDIGRAICAALLADGIAVAAIDIDREGLEALTRHLAWEQGAQGRVLPVHADVLQMESVLRASEEVRATLGDVSILVNNAGGITKPSLATTEERDWVRDIDLNLSGPWRCMKALQGQLIRSQPSVIINIASVNGLGIFGHPGYSAAKAGLIHLTRFSAVELGKHGVRSVALCPGSVKTRQWQERQAHSPNILAEATSWYPSRDTCTPNEVARLVALIAKPGLGQMNGAVITLDGGLSAGSDRLACAFTGDAI
jgi:NAD(P)-dependent dehydrogenase (short-subunit alcohol dehydrogenase family)